MIIVLYADHAAPGCRIFFALYAQFGPGKFPSTWYTVFYCVVCYIFVTLILNVFCYVKEGDAFLITHKKPVGGLLLGACCWVPAARLNKHRTSRLVT